MIKFNGTHIQLPFATPGFNGTIVCPKNGTHPPGPTLPAAAKLRGDALGESLSAALHTCIAVASPCSRHPAVGSCVAVNAACNTAAEEQRSPMHDLQACFLPLTLL